MKTEKNKKRVLILLALSLFYLLAAVAVRLLYLYEFSFSPLFDVPRGPDVQEYCNWAREIVAGRVLWPYVYIHAPLYPFFLALLYISFASFNNYFFLIRFTQIILGFFAVLPLAGIIVLIFREKLRDNPELEYLKLKPDLFAFLVLWLWYPPLIYYLGELTSEVLLIPLLAAAVCLLYVGEFYLYSKSVSTDKENQDMDKDKSIQDDNGKKKSKPIQAWNIFIAVAGICSGLAVITHPLSLFFMFSEMIYLFLRRNFKGLLSFGFCAFLMIAPVTYYNIFVLKEAIPIQANGGFNLYLGNNEESDGTCYLRPGQDWDDFHRGADYLSRDLGISKDALLIQKTVKYICNNPFQWLKLLSWKALLVWNHRELTSGADLYPLRYFTPFQRVFSWAFGVCAVLALTAVFINLKSRSFYSRYRHVLIIICAFWAAQALLVTSGRYRIAMVPFILILAAWMLSHIFSFVRERPGNNLRLIFSLLAAAAIVYIPQARFNMKQEQGEADSILAEAYLQHSDYANTERCILSAIEKQDPWSRNFNILGLLKEKQMKFRDAMACYLTAINADPFNPDSFMNVALLYSRIGEKKKAENFYKKAFFLRKPSDTLYYNYGLLCESEGRTKDAVTNYINCLKVNPANEMALNNLGVIFFNAGNFKAAAGFFGKSLKFDPMNTERMINLAYAEYAAGDYQKAEKFINKALSIQPDMFKAHELKRKIKESGRVKFSK